jgi:hypothetical protein
MPQRLTLTTEPGRIPARKTAIQAAARVDSDAPPNSAFHATWTIPRKLSIRLLTDVHNWRAVGRVPSAHRVTPGRSRFISPSITHGPAPLKDVIVFRPVVAMQRQRLTRSYLG